MKHLALLAVLLGSSGCLLGHYSQRGDRASLDAVGKHVTDGDRKVETDDRTAKLVFERRTCIDWKSTYGREVYEKRQYPAHVITPISMAFAFGGLITGLVSQEPGFLWPESRPAITPLSFAIGGVAAGVLTLAGLVPMFAGAHEPRSTLLRVEATSEYDEVNTECSEQQLTVTGALPFKAWIYDDPVTGSTPKSGVLDAKEAAIVALKGTRFTPAKLRHWQEGSEVYVKYELAGTPKQLEKVDLYELRIYADLLIDRCSEACFDAGQANVCRRRQAICEEEGEKEGFSTLELMDLCKDMRNTCLERESPNSKGFGTCFDACVHERLGEVFKKK